LYFEITRGDEVTKVTESNQSFKFQETGCQADGKSFWQGDFLFPGDGVRSLDGRCLDLETRNVWSLLYKGHNPLSSNAE